MKSASDYRAEAQACRDRAEESFERCDTDGFLSQYCSVISARLADRRAKILDNDGMASFTGLYEGERRVKAKMLNGTYGHYWLLHEDEAELVAARGKPFLPTGSNSRVLKKLGLAERSELAPAWADTAGNGTGLASVANVYIETYRTGDKWGGDAVLDEEVK